MLRFNRIFILRNKAFSIAVFVTLNLLYIVFFVSLIFDHAAIQGEEDAYVYNGPALLLDSLNMDFSKDDYEYLCGLDHIEGVGGHFREFTVSPLNTKNVKLHTGADVENVGGDDSDKMVLVAMLDIPHYDIFRKERYVSIVSGNYPCHGGIMIEKHFADQNNIEVGNEVAFEYESKNYSFVVEGIYFVDSDFEVLDTNDIEDDVYIYSPYNAMYMEYEDAVYRFGITDSRSDGCSIFIDNPENVEEVKTSIESKFDDRVEIYDNTSGYMQDECSIVRVMSALADVTKYSVLIIGGLLLVIVISFVYDRVRYDSAVFLYLGYPRSSVIIKNIILFLCYCTFAFSFAFIFVWIMHPVFINVVNDAIFKYSTSGTNGYGTLYFIPRIGLKFYIELDRTYIFNRENVTGMAKMFVYTFFLSVVIPVASILITDKKETLKGR